MGPVEVAVLRDALRLKPQAEQQAGVGNPLHQFRQGAAQLLLVGEPVPQAGMVIVSLAEPAVVQHKEFHPQLGGLLGHGHQFVPGEIEIGALPAVQQDRPAPAGPLAPADMVPDGFVEIAAQQAKAGTAVAENYFRGLEALAGSQIPAEAVGVDAADQPGLADLVLFHLHGKLAAVDERETVALPLLLIGAGGAEDREGVVVVAAGAPDTADGLDAVAHRLALEIPLGAVAAVEGDPVKIIVLPVDAAAGGLFQHHRGLAPVGDLHRPGDDVQGRQHPVQQLCLHPGIRVPQADEQGLGFLFAGVDGGQPLQGVFAGAYLVPLVSQVGRPAAVGVADPQGGDPVVPGAETAVFLGQQVGGIIPVGTVCFIGVSREAAADVADQLGEIAVIGSGPVVSMQQNAGVLHLHLVGGAEGVEGENAVFLVDMDCHGGPPDAAAGRCRGCICLPGR